MSHHRIIVVIIISTIVIIVVVIIVIILIVILIDIIIVKIQVADLKTARWGRPSVGTIGGKITGEDDEKG